jgi:hypothetical protein
MNKKALWRYSMKLNSFTEVLVPVILLLLAVGSAVNAVQITHGPYLLNQTETGVTVIWFTDRDCRSHVEYGTNSSLSDKVEAIQGGCYEIGRRHEVRITGLSAGRTYSYRAVSIEVTKWAAYYSTLGSTVQSQTSQFTTFDRDKVSFSFYMMSDIESDATRMNTLLNIGDWNTVDFGVFGGNVLSDLTSVNTIYSTFIDPVTDKFAKTTPIVYVRGNKEMNGEIGAGLYDYVPSESGKFYYTFSHGPALFLVFDSGQDSADATPRYGGLMKSESYRAKELAWFQNFVQTNGTLISNTPFKIALAHQPDWGYGDQAAWDNIANSADASLLIAGHDLVYSHTEPGSGKNFHTVVVGQNQLCKVSVSATELAVTVLNSSGTEVDAFTINKL